MNTRKLLVMIALFGLVGCSEKDCTAPSKSENASASGHGSTELGDQFKQASNDSGTDSAEKMKSEQATQPTLASLQKQVDEMKAQAAAKPAQADGPASGVPASGEFPVAEDTPKCARVQLEKIADGQLTSAERSTAMSDALSAFCLATPRPAVPYESGAPIEVKRNNASSVVVRWRIVNLLN